MYFYLECKELECFLNDMAIRTTVTGNHVRVDLASEAVPFSYGRWVHQTCRKTRSVRL